MNHKEITVYEPNQRLKIGFFQTWTVMFKNIVRSRELVFQLFKRDFFLPYKKSFLGIGWILLSPIIGIASWVFLNATGVLQPGDTGIPYPAYILISTSMWGLFMGFYSAAAGTLGAGTGFIMQVKYPHESLLLKQTAQHLASFLITFVLNIILLIFFGVAPTVGLLLFPLAIIPMFFLGAGLGLMISVISVVATDVTNFVNLGLSVLFYATPIIYASQDKDPLLQRINELNPLTYLVGGVRDLVIYGRMEHFERFLIIGILSFVFFLLAWRLFYVSEDKVIEKMI